MKLIDEWRTVAWRSASNWVATILGFLTGVLSPATYMAAFAFIGFIPSPGWQLGLAGLVGAIVIGGPVILARITAQPKLAQKIADPEKCDAP